MKGLKGAPLFESSVNPEGIQTMTTCQGMYIMFESSVNPEGIQTDFFKSQTIPSLRAV